MAETAREGCCWFPAIADGAGGKLVGMSKLQMTTSGKGWFTGPWNSGLPVAVGYADRGEDDPHIHDEMFEVYLVARGRRSPSAVSRRALRDSIAGSLGARRD